MVNCGVRMVNCRPRVTKHARRKITFFTETRARVSSLAKESRVKSYMQIISSSSRLTCRLCYWRRIRNLRLVYIHCVCLLRYRSSPRLERALYHRPRKRAHARSLPGRLSRLFLSFFLAGRISMPAGDVGVRTWKTEGAERERGSTLSRG